MWTKSYSKTVENLDATRVWTVWTDVNQWHTWQDDIESAKLNGEFKKGSVIHFKPKGGPNIRLELTEVELLDHGDKLEIKSTIRIEGPLSFLWRKLVAENVAKGLKEQTERLIEKAKNG